MKLKKLIFSMVVLALPLFISVGNVKADVNDTTLTYERMQGVYKTQTNKVTGAVYSHRVNKYLLNGKIAYCIEPMVDIDTKIYSSTSDWNVTSLSVEARRYIEKVGYFGYEYAGHNTDRYWLATQYLIWQKANPNIDVKFTTGENGTGEVIDLTNEINEILSLVNQYNEVSSFANTTVEGNIGDEITLTDTNHVLNDYNISYSGKHQITKENNTLKIKLDKTTIGEEDVMFIRSNIDTQVSIIYYNGVSQKLASLKISDPAKFSLKIKSNGGNVEIDKTGEKVNYENGSYNYENIKLPNTTFALYSNEDIKDSSDNIIYKKYDLVGTLTTDELGQASLTDLYFGKYFLVEGETSLNHVLDDKKYYFEITENDLIDGKIVKHFDFVNYLPKGTLEFTKTDLTDGKVIPNTVIQIFTEEDRIIYTGTTDENGKITITDLPIGKYYIIEKDSATGYQITDEKVYFEIKENGEIVKANMTNEAIPTPTVEVPNIEIEVPNTASYEINLTYVLGSLAILGGIGAILYDKKKKQK